MPEEIAGVVKIKPEPSKAVFAVEAASDLIDAAKDEIGHKRYGDAYDDARNAIRMASAGIMYNDGYVANTKEGAYDYMEKMQGGKTLAEDWKSVEVMAPENKGIIDRLLELLGLKKGSETNEELGARKALSVAETFVQSARTIIYTGKVPAWESTVVKE